MIKGIDHVVILVKDLAEATADYTELGFTVLPGGEHVDGASHNALIAFADGSYIELLAFKKQAPGHRWWPKATNEARGGEGLIDFALLPTEIENDISAARERGLAYQGPFPGGRLRPDGQEIKWQSGQPGTPDLPFLCGDITPRSLRVPSGPAWLHANGVTGIEAVSVLVDNLAESAGRYQALLGISPDSAGHAEPSATASKVFSLGPGKIILTELDTSAQDAKTGKGAGPSALRFKVIQPVSFEQSRTHSVDLSASS